MRFFVTFTLLTFCAIQGFSQKITTPKRVVGEVKVIKFNPIKSAPTPKKINFGKYTVTKYYKLTKKSANKKTVKLLVNSIINLDSNQIDGNSFETISFSIYEIEKMKKDDFLYRVFNQIIVTEMNEIPESITVHKTDLPNFFGIIQLPLNKIAFPYKGGIVIADAIL